MIPLKKSNLRRCFNFPLTATYDKYVSFQENFVPCISDFLNGIMFQAFCSVISYDIDFRVIRIICKICGLNPNQFIVPSITQLLNLALTEKIG
jgi:hypothetical protein